MGAVRFTRRTKGGEIEHKLAVNTDARPVKQVLRKQSKEKLEFIVTETDKLLEAGVIKA